MRLAKKILKRLLIGLVVLVVIAAATGYGYLRHTWPQTSGTLTIAGLQAPVDVIRDRWGIPHIFAQNEHDLFMAQGFVHAQDRLWQLEFNRRAGQGRLSEVLGPATVGTDTVMRTLGMYRTAQMQWGKMEAEDRAILESYAAGINAFIQTQPLPLEFTLLGYSPEPWAPPDSLAWGNLMSLSLGGNFRLELVRSSLISTAGEQITEELLPPYGENRPLIVLSEDFLAGHSLEGARFDGLEAIDALLGDSGPIWGSNNWVVHGSRTASGKPLLANDTHLGLSLPGFWYEVGLHGGRFNSVGFSLPGSPLVLIGHNSSIAWGQSNLNPDVQDFYIEKLNDPANPTQYEFAGSWHDLVVIDEPIQVKNGQTIPLKVQLTRHGPLMNKAIGKLEKAQPMALRWTVLEGSTIFKSIVRLNLAQNWQEYRDALSYWDAPGQNFVYADVEGNIGYQMTGEIPIRAEGHQGLVPVPGWTGEYEWQGTIPYEQLPHVLNPDSGFITTANNKVTDDSYPYQISYEWDPGYRAQRITNLLKEDQQLTIEDMRTIQADTFSLPAEAIRPLLIGITPQNALQQRALDELRTWDLRYETDRVGASVFETWLWFLMRSTIRDDLESSSADEYLNGQYERHGLFQLEFITKQLNNPQSPWFDDKSTPQVETRDEILQRSLTEAIGWLTQWFGHDPAGWNWGTIHTLTLAEAPFAQSRIPGLSLLFRNSAFPARGNNVTVNAGSYAFPNPFHMIHGTSQRQIVDLDNMNGALAVQATGQSGHVFHPHRNDMTELWQNLEYHPMIFNRESAQQHAEDTLTLAPA